MHALRDQNGNILAPCIHSRAQSGDLGYMARESCRQGPSFASRSPKSRMARRCCQRRAAFPRQRPAVRRNGPCALRQRHAVRPNGLCALRRGPGLLAACAPPAISLVPAGTARAPTRANRAPALSQPSPAHPWSRLRPPVPRHPPRLALPRGSRYGSSNSCEMVR